MVTRRYCPASKNQKSSYIDEIKFYGNLIYDSGNIATTFNEYFSNIGPNLANQINKVIDAILCT